MTELYADCPELDLDEKLLSQVMINLIQNSIEAMSETKDKKLCVSTICDSEGVRVEITDNGKGIHPEDIDKIFLPFYTTKLNGSGIGLSLAKQIIRLHGGSIETSSIENNKTSFTIEI